MKYAYRQPSHYNKKENIKTHTRVHNSMFQRIVLLDFIHRLVSQKIEELKIYTKYHNTHVHKIHTRVNY